MSPEGTRGDRNPALKSQDRFTDNGLSPSNFQPACDLANRECELLFLLLLTQMGIILFSWPHNRAITIIRWHKNVKVLSNPWCHACMNYHYYAHYYVITPSFGSGSIICLHSLTKHTPNLKPVYSSLLQWQPLFCSPWCGAVCTSVLPTGLCILKAGIMSSSPYSSQSPCQL